MTARTRDTLALFAIATLAIMTVLYGGLDLGGLFLSVLGHR